MEESSDALPSHKEQRRALRSQLLNRLNSIYRMDINQYLLWYIYLPSVLNITNKRKWWPPRLFLLLHQTPTTLSTKITFFFFSLLRINIRKSHFFSSPFSSRQKENRKTYILIPSLGNLAYNFSFLSSSFAKMSLRWILSLALHGFALGARLPHNQDQRSLYLLMLPSVKYLFASLS